MQKNIHIFRDVETHELEIHIGVGSNRLLFHSQSQASASLEQKLALNHCFHPGSNLCKKQYPPWFPIISREKNLALVLLHDDLGFYIHFT